MKVANYGLDELLAMVDNSANPELGLIDLVKTNTYARFWLDQAINDKWINLDIDELNYKLSDYHPSMAGQILLNKQCTRVYEQVLMNGAVALKTRRYQCKSMIDMLSNGEGKIFIAILQKNLPSLYKNITFESINTALSA